MKKVFYNGNVYTGDHSDGHPFTTAFIVDGDHFAAVDTDEEILALDVLQNQHQEYQFIDLQGKFVCAGFNDSHMHLLGLGQMLAAAPMHTCTDSLENLIKTSADFFRDHPVREGEWMLGRGWNHDYFQDVNRMPDRYDLDRISTTNPVCATRCCGHCLVVNSKALELLGYDTHTPSPEGGRIGVENGALDGRFYDNAMSLVQEFIPVPDKERIKDYIRSACKLLNSYGITSCQTDDFCSYRKVHWSMILDAYRELEEAGELTVRIYEQANFESLEALQEFVEAGNVTGSGSDYFKIGPLKMLGDGSLGARTAYLSRAYTDDPTTRGIPVFSQKQFDEMIGYANEHNMQVAVHAIGDACLDMVLEAIEKALRKHPRKDHRHGIVHCQITRPDQLIKIAELGLHVYAQSIFLDYDINIVDKRVGTDMAASSYCWKTLMNQGVSVSNGSDCPVELPDVLKGIFCAVSRRTVNEQKGPYLSEQAFTLAEALDSFTIRGAEASFEEQQKGLVKKGYLADFTIWPSELYPELQRISAEKSCDTAFLQIKPLELYLSGMIK